MKKFKIFSIITLLTGISSISFAQPGKIDLTLNYSVNSPLGNFKSASVSEISFRGWNGSLMYNINDKLAVGLGTGFNDYYQKYPRQVYEDKNNAISAVLTNSVQTTPVLVEGRYTFTSNSPFQPYIGLGVGGNLVYYRQYLGEFADSKSGFYFAAQPEVGANIRFSRNGTPAFTIGANYSYMPFNYGNVKDLNNWGVYAGFKFSIK
jgi:hypothetical protein